MNTNTIDIILDFKDDEYNYNVLSKKKKIRPILEYNGKSVTREELLNILILRNK